MSQHRPGRRRPVAALLTLTLTSGTLAGLSVLVPATAEATAPMATTLVVTASPTSLTAGGSVTGTVTAQDGQGNVATTDADTVTLTSTDPLASLAPVTLVNGVGSFSATLSTAGSQTVTATDSTISGVSNAVIVAAGATTTLTLTTLNSVVAGSSNTATVTPTDAYGNPTSPADVVHFSSTDPQAVLPADAAWNTVVGGFPVTLVAAGAQTLTVSDLTNPGVQSSSRAVTVVSGAAHSMDRQSGDAQSAAAGHTFGAPVMVLVTDASGNAVAGQTVVFSLPISSDSSFAGAATSSTVTDSSGVAVSGPLTAGSTPGSLTVTAAAQQVLFEPASSGTLPRTPVFNGSTTFTETISGSDAAAVATPRTSTGIGTAAQSVTVPVPAGGSITLLDANGHPVTKVVTADGTFLLDPATGIITFVATAGFSGTAPPVSYRVTDGYGQAATSTYSPTVTAPSASSGNPSPPTAAAGAAHVRAKARVVLTGKTFSATCTITGAAVTTCRSWLTARVKHHQVVLGTSKTTKASSRGTTVKTVIRLTARGRALAGRVGGVKVTLWASVTGTDGRVLSAKAAVTIVKKHVTVPARVLFLPGSAKLTASAKHQLKALRSHLGGVKTVTCVGYADTAGPTAGNLALGKARAKAVCAALARHGLKRVAMSYGDKRARAFGRSGNRRVQISLTY
ncbi:hypothetical protein acdb102_17510 [Acidothermaceae bacterium B102]|nr:hypothetical protein acdb102_17510 [Acidothermaceae bacterium B102]